MADTPEAGGAEEPQQPPITVNAQYIKDLSFEAPTAPGVFQIMQQQQPNIDISVNVDVNAFENNVFEIVLSIGANAKIGDDTAFLMELEYGGVFTLNCEPEHIHPLLYIECPRLLFPFARSVLGNTTREAGFPPLMLGPVDFVGMYQREAAKQAEQGEAASDDA